MPIKKEIVAVIARFADGVPLRCITNRIRPDQNGGLLKFEYATSRFGVIGIFVYADGTPYDTSPGPYYQRFPNLVGEWDHIEGDEISYLNGRHVWRFES
jgi:hypothetical protein